MGILKIFSSINSRKITNIDWLLFSAVMFLSGAGLVTMYSFSDNDIFFKRQVIWLSISLIVFFVFSFMDWRSLKRPEIALSIFAISCFFLFILFFVGTIAKGAERWISFGFFSFQPSDPAKVALIIVLAKYFSKRHVEIAHFKHVIVSGLYAFLLFILIFFQPNLSSSIIIFFIWFGMVMVSGISKKHILAVMSSALIILVFSWLFVFHSYQKQRIMTFVNPLADTEGAGYNALQSIIAVGSGQLLGKGVGFGTQSRLRFLPEYQTDFIFASFAEEWGFFGSMLLLFFYSLLIWRIIRNSMYGATNFEVLFGAGVAIWFSSHFMVHVGMNIGLMPVTGITLPFVSYGGSHLLTEFAALGILMGMRRYSRSFHREEKEERILV